MLMMEKRKTPPAQAKCRNLARIRILKTCAKGTGERALPASSLYDTLIIE
jgi:hypothetical protein